jgi:hypothetical protein
LGEREPGPPPRLFAGDLAKVDREVLELRRRAPKPDHPAI